MPGAWTKKYASLLKTSQRVFNFALESLFPSNNISSHDQVNQPYRDHAKKYSLDLPVSDQLFMGLDVGQTLFVPV